MTPDQIELVRGVVARVRDQPEFAAAFYRRLFAVAPDAAALFADLESQQLKITAELDALIDLLGDLPSLEARARELGDRHRGYGVRAAQYRQARQAMVEALTEVLGPEFGPAEADAWSRATSLITELMLTS
ncbi:MAG TPA: globin domain-containing protein [Acidimicrobiales bacterium]|nr:globin domain-containing protein [Acidimicrobiales bacterium]